MALWPNGLLALWPNGLLALWPYINKFGNWPVGAHVIRFATGVDKHKSICYHELYQWHTV